MNKKVALIARILLGLVFLVFGLNGFFQVIPMPLPSEAGSMFMGALLDTGYFFVFLKLVEISCGIMLLSGFYVPLALLILSPIVVNILLFHIFLDMGGLVMAVILFMLTLIVAKAYESSFVEVLKR